MSFNETLTSKLDADDLTWSITFSIELSDATTTNSSEITGIDLNSLESIGDAVFTQLIALIGDTYSFDAADVLADSFFSQAQEASVALDD